MPIIKRRWTNKYGFRYSFTLKGKHSGTFPTQEDAEAGLRAAQKNRLGKPMVTKPTA